MKTNTVLERRDIYHVEENSSNISSEQINILPNKLSNEEWHRNHKIDEKFSQVFLMMPSMGEIEVEPQYIISQRMAVLLFHASKIAHSISFAMKYISLQHAMMCCVQVCFKWKI